VNDLLRDGWEEHATIVEEFLVEKREAAPVGALSFWKSRGSWMEKQTDGSWKATDVEGLEDEGEEAPSHTVKKVRGQWRQKISNIWRPVEPGSKGEMPGEWKDKAEGIPDNSFSEHWDTTKGDFTPERRRLHREIKDKVLEGVRSVPEGQTPTFIFTMGVPASGKSTLLREAWGDEINDYAIVDTDDVRVQLPEFKAGVAQRAKNSSKIVHTEASCVSDDIRKEAIDMRANIVLDGVGGDAKWYRETLIPEMRKAGYRIGCVFVHDGDIEAVKEKAELRGKKSGRFVPEDSLEQLVPKLPKNFLELHPECEDFFFYLAGRGDDRSKLAWKRKGAEGIEEVLDEEGVKEFVRAAGVEEWSDYMASLPALREDRKLPPPNINPDRFASLYLKFLHHDQVQQELLPEIYTDGVEIPTDDPVPPSEFRAARKKREG